MAKLIKGVNDLATVRPDLAAEWHPTKNGELKPTDVMAGSDKKVWWFFPYDDPKTGKHFDFEWKRRICDRNNGAKCPYLFGYALYQGFNDLATVNPELAKEWHPTKNGKLTPQDVPACNGKKVWWYLPYDDPRTGKHFNFEWQATVRDRNRGSGCPYFTGASIYVGFNDLATVRPDLAAEWHPTKNGNLTPQKVTANNNKKVWWYRPYDDPLTGKHFDFEWQAQIKSRNNNRNCPYISVSKTTQLVQILLQTKIINFVCEHTFADCKNKNLLPFDFYINNKYIVEIDGEQHFKIIDYFGGKKDFKQRIYRDNLKNQYCYDNNIPLLRIPYIYDPIVDKEKIEQFVLNFISTGEVPQEIIDFYSKYKFSNYANCILSKNLSETA